MMLALLSHQVEPFFTASTHKDLKTAVNTLAKALDYPDPSTCPLEAYYLPLPDLYHRLETYLLNQGKKSHTIRNTKNNLSRLFRIADAHNLLKLKPPTPQPTYSLIGRRSDTPRRPETTAHPFTRGSYFLFKHWPSQLVEAYQAFYDWATQPFVPSRDARFRKRSVTLDNYRANFEGFFGYLVHERHIPLQDLSFDQLFDLTLIRAYTSWHVNEKHHRVTVRIHNYLSNLLTLTHQYRPLPDLRIAIKDFQKTLPKPTKLFDKTHSWVPLAELKRIAQALWPLPQTKGYIKHLAVRAGFSLILQIWTFIPYRSRNIREMRLEENLYRDPHGYWRIKFAGEQLKVSEKRGKPNTFDMPFPPPLVSILEEYLDVWRPLLTPQYALPHLFINRDGKPWSRKGLERLTRNTVYRYTGKFFHPHMIRTIWATEWIKNTHGDFYTAAIMLNDTLEMVIKMYTHLLEEDVAEKAFKLIGERNGYSK